MSLAKQWEFLYSKEIIILQVTEIGICVIPEGEVFISKAHETHGVQM
jgi:hypothetical protein